MKSTHDIKSGAKPIIASELKNKESGQDLWRSVIVGGVPGILIGASGMGAVEATAAEFKSIDNSESNSAEAGEIQVAHSVNDGMSFSEAFAAARAEVGPGGAFVWHGNVYTTFRSDDHEWLGMTPEERMEHSQHVMSQVQRVPYVSSGDEQTVEADPTNSANINEDLSFQESSDVHILSAERIVVDGEVRQIGRGEVDGHYAGFVDVDNDGEVDVLVVDENDNGRFEEDETYDVQGEGITIDAAALDDQLYADMPDYTNDADTSSLV